MKELLEKYQNMLNKYQEEFDEADRNKYHERCDELEVAIEVLEEIVKDLKERI
jgi:uncharacterized membrane protein (DUF106 family)